MTTATLSARFGVDTENGVRLAASPWSSGLASVHGSPHLFVGVVEIGGPATTRCETAAMARSGIHGGGGRTAVAGRRASAYREASTDRVEPR